MTSNLEQQVKFMEALLDRMPVEVAVRDAGGRYTLVNRAWEISSGMWRAQVLGKTAFDLFPAQRAQSIEDSDRAALALGGRTLYSDFQVRSGDGGQRYLAVSKTAMLDADGKVAGVLATATDVTARREAEQALKDQVKLTRDLIDANPMPIYLKDAELRYVDANPAFVRHTGWTVEAITGRTAFDVIPVERARIYDKMERALLARGEGSSTIEIELPRPEGMRHYLMTKSVLQRSDGTVRGLVCTIAEVTPLKRIEAELRASREAALQAAQAKAAFLATMSHEIRTPLNGVIGMTGVLLDTGLTPEQRDYVETIRVSGESLLAVINDILDFSKIESGKLELEREPLELARVIEQAFDILGERARAKRLELLYQVGDDVPPHVYGDATYLRQIIVNLVGNAVKFTEAGEVLVGVRRGSGGNGSLMLEFRVSDTGVGIAPERLDALFQPFIQGDASTTRKHGGTGLGLAICKRLTELMGGTITAESEPGRGSVFLFTVQCEPAAAPAATDIDAGRGELSGKSVLVVDDNASNLRILEHQLQRWGLRPRAVEGARAALALLDGGARFDAAIVDYHMPEMDGVALTQAIKRHAAGAGLPVILLSSAVYRRGKGANLFAVQLLKPTRQSQLFDALVTALTARAAARRAPEPASAPVPLLARQLPLNVLVVDDNDVNRRIAVLLLRRLGYSADMANDGRQAVAAAGKRRYDIVFMDVQMPEMDGYEATRAINAGLGAQAPVIVAMTANAMEGDREACLAAGMSDYLAKPLEMAALQAVLQRWGRRDEPPPPAVPADRAMPREAADRIALDRSRLEEIGQFDKRGSLVRKLIRSFVADGKARTEAIARAVARRDTSQLAAAAHALKGAALNVGASGLAEACASLERSARAGNELDLAPLAGELQQRFSATARALAQDALMRAGPKRSSSRARVKAKRSPARRKR